MDKHRFVLHSLGQKSPEVDQLLSIYNAAHMMNQERAIEMVCQLSMACCRLQQEIKGYESLGNSTPRCKKCQGEGTT